MRPSWRSAPTTAPEGLAWIEGRVLPLAEARVPLLDRGYRLGDGVFETMRTHRGRIVQLEGHLDRLERGARMLGVAPGVRDEARGVAEALVDRSRPGQGSELYLRLNLTTGTSDDLAGEPGAYALSASATPLRAPPRRHQDPGLRLVTANAPKPTTTPLASVKPLSFLPYVHARREARARGADDALLLNEHGRVAEATTSNVLAVVQGRLHAPGADEGAVAGLTRELVLAWAREAGLAVEAALPRRLAEGADEVWLTNSIVGVLPVAELDGRPLAGARGELFAGAERGYRQRLDGA